jgi:hypothetical protein
MQKRALKLHRIFCKAVFGCLLHSSKCRALCVSIILVYPKVCSAAGEISLAYESCKAEAFGFAAFISK